jgi:thiol-disulfide isomerase/thioredoxin
VSGICIRLALRHHERSAAVRLTSNLPAPGMLALGIALIGLSACFPPPPSVRGLPAAGWKSALDSRRGSIVAMNVWATWCQECVEDFPAFIELRAHYSGRGIEFLTLSLDDVGPAKDVGAVASFLRLQVTGMPNYILLEPLSNSMDLLGISGLPAVLVYRPDGSVAFRLEGDEFENRVGRGDIEAALQSLLPDPLPELGE